MKVDLSPSPLLPTEAGSAPKATRPAEQAAPQPAASQEGDVVSPVQQSSEVVASYHFTDPGRQLYFQLVDEKSGQVIGEVPSSAVLKDEEMVDEYLKSRGQ